MTTWIGRTEANTTWGERDCIQNDFGAGLDEDLARMTDEDGNVILFHTGDFECQDTDWIAREII